MAVMFYLLVIYLQDTNIEVFIFSCLLWVFVTLYSCLLWPPPFLPLHAQISFASLPFYLLTYKGIQNENSRVLSTVKPPLFLYCSGSGKSKPRKTKNSPSKPKTLENSGFGCAEVLSSIKLFIRRHYFPMSRISTMIIWLYFIGFTSNHISVIIKSP